MSDVRSMFVGKEESDRQSEHEQKMREYREQRTNAVNILLGVLIFVVCILILVGGVCAAALLLRAAF